MNLILLSGLSLLTAGLGWLILRRLGKRSPVSPFLLGAFIVTGLLSAWPGQWLYAWADTWFAPLASGRWRQVLFIWLVNAPMEELAKYGSFAVVAGLLGSLRRPGDGFLLGAAVGLGFGLGENWLYGWQQGWETLILRVLVALPGHLIYGAFWGGLHGLAILADGDGRRWVLPLAALVPASFFHAVFNTLVLVQAPWGIALLSDGVILSLTAMLWRRSLPMFQSSAFGKD